MFNFDLQKPKHLAEEIDPSILKSDCYSIGFVSRTARTQKITQKQ